MNSDLIDGRQVMGGSRQGPACPLFFGVRPHAKAIRHAQSGASGELEEGADLTRQEAGRADRSDDRPTCHPPRYTGLSDHYSTPPFTGITVERMGRPSLDRWLWASLLLLSSLVRGAVSVMSIDRLTRTFSLISFHAEHARI